MDTSKSTSSEKTRRRKRKRLTREEKFARQWAPTIHVELLTAWGRANEGPMPTRDDAERIAVERIALLKDGLGELAEASPKMLDSNQKSARRQRGWDRNAWPRRRRYDREDGPWWDYPDEED